MKHLRTGMGAGVLLAALGLTGVIPTEAEAAGCNAPGSRIGPAHILYSPVTGAPIGSVEVYYSQQNGGTNSACLHYQGAAFGQSLKSMAAIDRCSSYYHCEKKDLGVGDIDQGMFTQYAGPAVVTGTRKKCVHVRGLLQDPHYKKQFAFIELSGVGCEATPRVRYFFLGASTHARQNESRIVTPSRGVPVPVEVVEMPTNPPSVEPSNGPR